MAVPHFAAYGAKPWSDDEPLELMMVVPEGPDVATFAFRAASGAWFNYMPGQFLTLELPLPGGTIHRTYTISSSPSRPLSISITVKAQPGSIGTRWMLEHLKPGMQIRAFGPAGIFSFAQKPAEKYLFISAGSGITPMMSMTTWMWDSAYQPDITFIHAARRPSEILFRERLENMANRTPGLSLHFVVEELDAFRAWPGYRGRLNQIMLGLMAPDYMDRDVYCCGPEPFMQAVRDMLGSIGYDMTRYHQESFQAPVHDQSEVTDHGDITPQADQMVELTFLQSGVTVPCAQTDTVLTASRMAGLNIPSGCTFGLCGTCKVRKTAGEVHMVHNGGISDEDVAEGWILACCSKPMGAVSIEA